MKCKKTAAIFCSAFMLSCFVPTLGYAITVQEGREILQKEQEELKRLLETKRKKQGWKNKVSEAIWRVYEIHKIARKELEKELGVQGVEEIMQRIEEKWIEPKEGRRVGLEIAQEGLRRIQRVLDHVELQSLD